MAIISATLMKRVQNMSEVELYEAVYTDPLTEALNRRAFELRDFRNCTLAIVDLDSLKYINDTKGHAKGDKLIKLLVALLATEFGKENVYRLGFNADEFAVLVNATRDNVDKRMLGVQDYSNIFSFGTAECVHGQVLQGSVMGLMLEKADKMLSINKRDREKTGKRASRGEVPAYLRKV